MRRGKDVVRSPPLIRSFILSLIFREVLFYMLS
jgi:hypothetical protein